jgi:hypothetical protein
MLLGHKQVLGVFCTVGRSVHQVSTSGCLHFFIVQVGEQKRALLALHALVTSQAAAPLLGLAAPQPQQGSGQAAGKVTRASATQQRSAAALAQKLLDLLVQVLETAADAGSGAEGQQKAGRSQARYQELTQVSLQLAVALVPTWELQLAAEGVDKEHLLRWVPSGRRQSTITAWVFDNWSLTLQ